MGCGNSLDRHSSQSDHKSVPYRPDLTPRQQELLRFSWDLIQKDMLVTGLEIYANFLKNLESEILLLFPKIIQTDKDNERLIVHEENLQHHVMIVMKGIGKVVDNLDNPALIQSFLSYVGQRHVQSKVKPHMLERLWPSIDDSFRTVLQDVYTPEVRSSWQRVINFMIDKISESMEEAEQKQDFRLANDKNSSFAHLAD
ncbi:neuroglobin-like [Crassostrea virginica]|uniref:Uncharacterized protein LOC111131161 n=1 Tax=Crassostrea virginica TaxID=6565 RepID=A0A8B8E229_CRAVI|nr:uncharacterized protein LOC111131161 [Crassostrea virginica]